MCFNLIFLWFFLFCKKDCAFYAGEFVWNCRFGPIENGVGWHHATSICRLNQATMFIIGFYFQSKPMNVVKYVQIIVDLYQFSRSKKDCLS
jgi:hypothetical protein